MSKLIDTVWIVFFWKAGMLRHMPDCDWKRSTISNCTDWPATDGSGDVTTIGATPESQVQPFQPCWPINAPRP